jgi:hypothetical protein
MNQHRIVMYELELEHIGYEIFLTDVNFRVGMPWYLRNKQFCDHVTYMSIISEIYNSQLHQPPPPQPPPQPPPPQPPMLNASAA